MSAAGAASLELEGGSENVFRRCVIGVDTIARDADVAEIRFLGDSPSPWIENSVLKDLRTRYPDIKFKAHNGQDLVESIDIRAGMA
jgi:hypothetical protein